MISKSQLFGAALAALLVYSVSGAQSRTGSAAAAPTPEAPAAPAVKPAPRPRAASPKPPSGQPVGANQTARGKRAASESAPVPFPNSPSLDNLFGAPGFAAVGGPLLKDSFSHFGHREHSNQDTFVPIFFGYPYYYDGVSVGQTDPSEQSGTQPSLDSDQQSVPEQQAADLAANTEDKTGNLPEEHSDARSPEPVRDIGNFILVRRDGSTLLASAFSVVGTQLRYVTPEGIRRTLPMADLDEGATQQINEDRGTTLQFHN